jgi:amino acid transporter
MTVKAPSKIGFTSMVLLGVNGIIGSGIFLLPGQVMAITGPGSLLVYGFVTLIVLMIAWCFAKCAALFNRNGGAFVYAKEAFGPFIGFEIGLMRWVVGMIAWATMAVAFVTALSTIWPPALQEPIRSILLFGMIGGLGIINILGINWIKPLNNIVTIAKLLPLLFFIFMGIYFLFPSQLISSSALTLDFNEGALGAAALLIFYAFSGFENLVVVAGEMDNPKKNLPLAVMIVVAICSSIYILIQMISMGVLGVNLSGSVTPIADAADVIWGVTGKWLVMSAMLISIGGINICNSFVVPRSGESLADEGMLPSWIAYRGSHDTPICAILLTITLTATITLFGSFAQLATISVIARFVQYTSTCLAAIVLGRSERKSQGVIRKTIELAIPILGLAGMAWLICQASWIQLVWGFGALAIGVPLYFIQSSQSFMPKPQDIQESA